MLVSSKIAVFGRLIICSTLLCSGLVGCGGGDHTVADEDELRALLQPGATIRLGDRDYVGTFLVPPGVTITGTDRTFVRAPPGTAPFDGAVFAVNTGGPEQVTTLRNLEIGTVGGVAAIHAFGSGQLVVDRCYLHVSEGVGIAAERISALHAIDTLVEGNIQPAGDDPGAARPQPTNASAYGIVTHRVADVLLERVDVTGMAVAGGLFVESDAVWTTGSVSNVLGTGVMGHGGSAALDDVSVSRTLGSTSLVPSYQVIAAAGASLTVTGGEIRDGANLGVICDSADLALMGATVTGHMESAVWAQNGCSLDVQSTMISDSKLAGISVVAGSSVTIGDSEIRGVQVGSRLGEAGLAMVGDGVQLVGPTSAALTNVVLADNARSGVVWDLESAAPGAVTFIGVSADGNGAALGAVAQNGTAPAGWDDGIERRGVTVANDATFRSMGSSLQMVGVVAPSDFSERSGAADVVASGLEAVGIVMPAD